MLAITIQDRAGARPVQHPLILEWRKGVPCTAAALIRERVRIEYEKTHDSADGSANHLVRLPPKKALMTLDEAIAKALEGFEKNAFILTVDGRQIESLDTRIPLSTETEIVFIKFVPLEGG